MERDITFYRKLRLVVISFTLLAALFLLVFVPLEYKVRIGIPLFFCSSFLTIILSRKMYNLKNNITRDCLERGAHLPRSADSGGYDLMKDLNAGYNGSSPLKDVFRK